MENFHSLGLPQPLMHSLEQMNFTTPTPIQAQAIPLALEGKDVLGSAQTGTGKTGAFGIPLVAKLLSSPRGSAMILTPTRELAVQVLDTITKLIGKNSAIKTALIIGGDSMPKQLQQLRMRPRIIVGTPGRINDHLARGSMMLHDTTYLVLDETDRMLDMGFGVQLEKIAKFLPKQRQTLMFSATLPHNIVKLSEKYLTNPVRISVGSNNTPIAQIAQEVIHVAQADKFNELVRQLDKRAGSIIIFVKTKWGAEKMADKLRKQRFSADAIHGDLRQNQRDRVIAAFREKKHRIMVATDIAARGLDIPHIEHVINYDLPQQPEDYIHRIGRTARAGAEGSAVNLIASEDAIKWRAIQKLINPNVKQEKVKHENSHRGRGGYGQGGGNRKHGGSSHRVQGARSERTEQSEITATEQVTTAVAAVPAPRAEQVERTEHAPRAERSEGRSEQRSERRFEGRNNRSEGRSERRFENRSERNDRSEERTERGERSEGRSERKPRHRDGRNGDRSKRQFGERNYGDRNFGGDHKKRDFHGERDGNREERGNRDHDGNRSRDNRDNRNQRDRQDSRGYGERREGDRKFGGRKFDNNHKKRDFHGERDGNREQRQGDDRDGNRSGGHPSERGPHGGGGKRRTRHGQGNGGNRFGGGRREGGRSHGNDNRGNRGDKPQTRSFNGGKSAA